MLLVALWEMKDPGIVLNDIADLPFKGENVSNTGTVMRVCCVCVSSKC